MKEERIVEVPKVLQDLLDAQPEERDFFNSLSYTNRKEYVNWLESAKKEETRIQRLAAYSCACSPKRRKTPRIGSVRVGSECGERWSHLYETTKPQINSRDSGINKKGG